jgi:putative membrane protein
VAAQSGGTVTDRPGGEHRAGEDRSGEDRSGGDRGGADRDGADRGAADQGAADQGAADQGAADGRDDGTEPDVRYTFANERTFLAWSRTSLALVVGGLAIAQLLPPFPGIPWGRHVLGTPLILLGSGVSVISYTEWRANQRALRHGQPLARSRLPQILAVAIAAIGLVAAMLALLSGLWAH